MFNTPRTNVYLNRKCIQFNADRPLSVNAYLRAALTSVLKATYDGTVCGHFWFEYTPTADTGAPIFAFIEDHTDPIKPALEAGVRFVVADNTFFIEINHYNNSLSLINGNAPNRSLVTSIGFPNGAAKPHFVSFRYDGVNPANSAIYVDGVSQTVTANTTDPANPIVFGSVALGLPGTPKDLTLGMVFATFEATTLLEYQQRDSTWPKATPAHYHHLGQAWSQQSPALYCHFHGASLVNQPMVQSFVEFGGVIDYTLIAKEMRA